MYRSITASNRSFASFIFSYSHGEKTKVKTHVTHQDSGSAGDFVEAKPLTYLEGNTKGRGPGSANPPGWRFAQNLNEQFGGAFYIRAVSYTHLTLPTTPYV